jgi:two-component system OmpR family response regulator
VTDHAAPQTARLLVVEDDEGLIGSIRRGLEEEGYAVDTARSGEEGLMQARADAGYDLLVIDWRLPGAVDGRALVEALREDGRRVPILMLTALRSVDHRVAGLDAGADDYVTKPFSFEELLARLRAMLRRADASETGDDNSDALRAGALEIDAARRQATLGGHPLSLRPKEFGLLELLLRRRGEVVTRTVIAERVWGSPFDVTDNAIDVTVSGLRRILDEGFERIGRPADVEVKTVRGAGYRLSEAEDPFAEDASLR